MFKKQLFVLGCALVLGISGCSSDEEEVQEQAEVLADEVEIVLEGTSISCVSDAVQIDGTRIIISEEATYIFKGELEDGQFVVNAGEEDKPHLVFDGASINCDTSAALYVLEADKVVVTLVDGTDNELSNGGSFEAIDDNNIDGAVFSKQDLSFNGAGSLKVSSPVSHGIVCKDDLVFENGNYEIESAAHGIDVNDSIRIAEASLLISAGKDGIHAENEEDAEKGFVYIENGTFDVTAEEDGISASCYLSIEEGTFHIVTGGGSENAEQKTSEGWGGGPGGMMPGHGSHSNTSDDSSTSMKGLKATGDMTIEAGTFTIDSADDAVHSNSCITVNNGTFAIASGDDGFHADDTLLILDGMIDISGSYEGLEALHMNVEGGTIKIVSTDDGINAAGGTDSSGTGGPQGDDKFRGPGGMSSNSDGSIVISGGNIYINASGDGIDSNGYLEITGGYTVVVGPTRGDTATLDYDTTATITGGTFIGTGAAGMAQTFSDSEQGVFAVQVGGCPAGTEFELTDSEGNVVIQYAPELDYAVIILSTEEMVKGELYTITIEDVSGEFEAY